MKKKFYSCLLALAALTIYSSEVNAQYYITSINWFPDTLSGSTCSSPVFYVNTNAYVPGLSIKTYYGNGTSSTSPVFNGGGYGFASCSNDYSFPGTYTIKNVLFNGTAPVDSVVNGHEFLYCNTLIVKCVYDSLGTGIYDSSRDHFINTPFKLEVDHNGIPIDTITIMSGTYYPVIGAAGDVYAFKILNLPIGLNTTIPAGGVIYDTVQPTSDQYLVKYFGFNCTGATGFDLAVNAVVPVTGIHDQWGNIYVSNVSCYPADATVTLTFSPKYVFDEATPAYSFASGNTISWNLTGVSINSALIDIYYVLIDAAGDLVAGDTVQEHITVTPTSGDANPANNVEIIIDTVKAGVDPNEMSVSPSGFISSGTNLKYTIGFENTGNDTAFNISVYDTLSDDVDVKSLDIVMASAVMNIAILNKGGHNIVKFDFPNINLLDSSHHGHCDGAVIFTVNAKSGLPNGTTVFNHAGIFFDYNPVVMTNTVEDIIGMPSGLPSLDNTSKVEVYPNPANNELTIKADNGNYNTATITNIIGQVMMTQQLATAQAKVNIGQLPAGIYIITLKGDSGVRVQKFEKM